MTCTRVAYENTHNMMVSLSAERVLPFRDHAIMQRAASIQRGRIKTAFSSHKRQKAS